MWADITTVFTYERFILPIGLSTDVVFVNAKDVRQSKVHIQMQNVTFALKRQRELIRYRKLISKVSGVNVERRNSSSVSWSKRQ